MDAEKNAIDSFVEKLLKLIPVEIIVVYATIISFVPEEFHPNLIIFLVLLIITPLYLMYALNVTNISQIIVSTLAFIIWVFYLGGAFKFFPWYEQWMAGTLLVIFSLIPPMVLKSHKAVVEPYLIQQKRYRLKERDLNEPAFPDHDDKRDSSSNSEDAWTEPEINKNLTKSWREI